MIRYNNKPVSESFVAETNSALDEAFASIDKSTVQEQVNSDMGSFMQSILESANDDTPKSDAITALKAMAESVSSAGPEPSVSGSAIQRLAALVEAAKDDAEIVDDDLDAGDEDEDDSKDKKKSKSKKKSKDDTDDDDDLDIEDDDSSDEDEDKGKKSKSKSKKKKKGDDEDEEDSDEDDSDADDGDDGKKSKSKKGKGKKSKDDGEDDDEDDDEEVVESATDIEAFMDNLLESYFKAHTEAVTGPEPTATQKTQMLTIEQQLAKLNDEIMEDFYDEAAEIILNEEVSGRGDILSQLNKIEHTHNGEKIALSLFDKCVSNFSSTFGKTVGGATGAAVVGAVTGFIKVGSALTIGVGALSAAFLVWLALKICKLIMNKRDCKDKKGSLKKLLGDIDAAIAAAEDAGDKKQAAQLKAGREKVQAEYNKMLNAKELKKEMAPKTEGAISESCDGCDCTVDIKDGKTVDVTDTIMDILAKSKTDDTISDRDINPNTDGIVP